MQLYQVSGRRLWPDEVRVTQLKSRVPPCLYSTHFPLKILILPWLFFKKKCILNSFYFVYKALWDPTEPRSWTPESKQWSKSGKNIFPFNWKKPWADHSSYGGELICLRGGRQRQKGVESIKAMANSFITWTCIRLQSYQLPYNQNNVGVWVVLLWDFIFTLLALVDLSYL